MWNPVEQLFDHIDDMEERHFRDRLKENPNFIIKQALTAKEAEDVGKCNHCRARPVQEGKSQCETCLERLKEYSKVTFPKKYVELKTLGICVYCKKKKARPKRIGCQECSDHQTESRRKRNTEKKDS